MPDFGSALWNKPTSGDTGEGSGGASDPVTRSLRFDTNGKLSRTFGTPNSKKTFTIAFWVKRAGFSSTNYKEIWQYNRGGRGGGMGFSPTQSNWMDEEEFQFSSRNANTGVADVNIALTTRFRDPAAWMHIALVVDTTLGSSEAADRIKIFVNNERQTNYDTSHTHSYYWPAQNYEFSEIFGGTGAPQNIGLRDTNNHPLNGYLADIYFIDGAAIEPNTNFIESTGYGSYKPKAFDMSGYSGNSFHIDAQPSHDADLLASSIDRNDGDTLFADAAKGHTITRSGALHKDTVGNPFDSNGTAMFFDGSNDYIKVASASSDFAFGTSDYTVEGWFYFNHLTGIQTICDFRPTNSIDSTRSFFGTTGSGLYVYFNGGNTTLAASGSLSTNSWHHIAFARNSGYLKTYINGTLKSTISASDNHSADATPHLGSTNPSPNHEGILSGYIYDFRITKGTALYTSGFTAPSTAFEINPVYIGGDQSGNKNHFAPTNISGHDVVLDTPTKNYATWNPLDLQETASTAPTFTEGNLSLSTNSSGYGRVHSTISLPSTGKWYAEFYSTSFNAIGVRRKVGGGWPSGSSDLASVASSGSITNASGTSQSGLASWSSGDILGVEVNCDDNTIQFLRNGSNYGTSESFTHYAEETFFTYTDGSSGTAYSAIANFGQDPTFAGNYTGTPESSEWAHSPSTGFKSLNTSNLADPSVTPAENFNSLVYQGASPSDKAVTGVGFQPDLVWIKARTQSYNHAIYDSVRGATKELHSNTTNTEDTDSNGLKTFDSDGFTVGSDGEVGDPTGTRISWNWKAHQGGSTSYSNTLTLDVRDNYGGGSGWGTTKLEVWEGSTKLTDITNPPSSSSKIYNIKTNDLDKIKIVWYVDGSAGDWYNMYAVLKNSSNTTLASWDGNSWSGNSSDAPSDDDNFYLPSSFDSTNAATTGVVEAADADTERYNSSAGFTIIKYAGDGSTDGDTKTLDHSLGVPLEFVIAKKRTSNDGYDNGDWIVWHKDLGSSEYLFLNENYAKRTESSGYDLIATATSGSQHQVVVNNGTDNSSYNYHYLNSGPDNGTGEDYILYGWAGVEGYSKFGKYTGNGSSDGPFIYTGFRPAFVLWKRATGSSNSWNIMDNKREGYNPQNDLLFPDSSTSESNVTDQDLLSNGFKLRTSGAGRNANNETFIYAAWAEAPFARANAR